MLLRQAPASSPRSAQRVPWEGAGRGASGREATADLARRMSDELAPHARSGSLPGGAPAHAQPPPR